MKLGLLTESSLKTKIPLSRKIIQLTSKKQEYGVFQKIATRAITKNMLR